MSKLTLEIPDSLHRAVKSFASGNGISMKDFFIDAAIAKMKNFKETDLENIKNKPTKKMTKKDKKYISEEEADKMLKPYLLRMVQRIESGQEDLTNWQDFKKELEK